MSTRKGSPASDGNNATTVYVPSSEYYSVGVEAELETGIHVTVRNVSERNAEETSRLRPVSTELAVYEESAMEASVPGSIVVYAHSTTETERAESTATRARTPQLGEYEERLVEERVEITLEHTSHETVEVETTETLELEPLPAQPAHEIEVLEAPTPVEAVVEHVHKRVAEVEEATTALTAETTAPPKPLPTPKAELATERYAPKPVEEHLAQFRLIREIAKAVGLELPVVYEHVETLLRAIASRDERSIARNPAFIMGVKLLEMRPLVPDDVWKAFTEGHGIEGFEEVLVRIARGEPLAQADIDKLVVLSSLYVHNWNRFNETATLTLDVSLSEESWRTLVSTGYRMRTSVYRVPLSALPQEVRDEYYLSVLSALKSNVPGHRRDFLESIERVKTLENLLTRIDVLGWLSTTVSSNVTNLLKPLIGEKAASVVGSFLGGFTTATVGTAIAVGTGGLATPLVLGLATVSTARALVSAGARLDNPVEAELLVTALKESWPEIVAGLAGAVAGATTGVRAGEVVAEKVTIPVLARVYATARARGLESLANMIARAYAKIASERYVTLRLETDQFDYTLFVDEEAGTIYVMTSAKGEWRVVDLSKTNVENAVVVARGGDFSTAYLRELVKRGRTLDSALRELDELIKQIPPGARTTKEVFELLSKALKDARVLNTLAEKKVAVLHASGDSVAFATDTEVLVLARTKLGDVLVHSLNMPTDVARSMPLYIYLRELGVSVDDLVSLFAERGFTGTWVAKLGGYDIVFSEGRLIIGRGTGKLVEVTGITKKLVENLPTARDAVNLMLSRGVDIQVVKSIATSLAGGPPTPELAPGHVALQVARIYGALAEALGGRGALGEHVYTVVTDRGAITAKVTTYIGKDASAIAEQLKVLSTDNIFRVARECAERAGAGGVHSQYIIRIPADRARAVLEALDETFKYISKLAGRAVSADEVANAIARAVEKVSNVAGGEAGNQVLRALVDALEVASSGYTAQFLIPFTVSTSTTVVVPVVLATATPLATATTAQQVARAVRDTVLKHVGLAIQLRQLYHHIAEYTEVQATTERVHTAPVALRSEEWGEATERRSVTVTPRTVHEYSAKEHEEEVRTSLVHRVPGELAEEIALRPRISVVPVPIRQLQPTTVEDTVQSTQPLTVRQSVYGELGESISMPPTVVDYIVIVPLPEIAVATPPPAGPGGTVTAGGTAQRVPRIEFVSAPLPTREYAGRLVREVVVI